MAPTGMERKRYAAKKRSVAAVAVFVALAAVPVLADTAQHKVVSRLSSETSTAAGGQIAQGNKTGPGAPASFQMRQGLGQDTHREKVIRRLAGETPPGARGTYAEITEGLQSTTAASLEVEHKQREIRTRLHGAVVLSKSR